MANASQEADHRHRWAKAPGIALERLPLSYRWQLVILGLVALISQVLEYRLRDPGFQNWMRDIIEGLAFVGVLVYVPAYLRVLKQEAIKGLSELRAAVLVGEAEYEGHVHRTLRASRRVEAALLVLSLAISLALFFLPPHDLLTAANALPGGSLIVGYLIASYALLGWLLLVTVYAVIRYARGLGALARCPLSVNVFDPTNLLPFSRLSLWYSLAPVGPVLIPTVLLGPPRQAGLVMIFFSLVSLFLLFIPLWGVRGQIRNVKARALANIGGELMAMQKGLLEEIGTETEKLPALSARVEALMKLRKHILDGPDWPFRNVGAAFRAVVATVSPLAYFYLGWADPDMLLPPVAALTSWLLLGQSHVGREAFGPSGRARSACPGRQARGDRPERVIRIDSYQAETLPPPASRSPEAKSLRHVRGLRCHAPEFRRQVVGSLRVYFSQTHDLNRLQANPQVLRRGLGIS